MPHTSRRRKISFSSLPEPIAFTKMAGAGNDFVMIDNRTGHIREVEELTRRICTRRLSVGGDGLVLIEPSSVADLRMRYFNADGSLGEFCANGTRCAARYAFLREIAPAKMTIETDAGVVAASIEDDLVTLAVMTPQQFRADRPLRLRDGSVVPGSSLTVGVPHYVTFLREIWGHDIVSSGREIRWHSDLQPAGANVNFVVVTNRHSIEVRTYERGVEDETLSCGSGVVAAAFVSAMFGKVDPPVAVRTRSGRALTVDFTRSGDRIDQMKLTGDARVVYDSHITAETLAGFDPQWVRQPTEATTAT